VDVATMSRFFALLAFVAGAGAIVVTASALARRGPLVELRAALAPLALPLAWLVAAVCMAGSLYFSEVAHFVPCRLCWYQRIAMYPLVLLLGIAVLRRDRAIRLYAIPLASIGAAISIYHVQLERFPDQATFCSLEAPCTIPPVEQFGFVTLAVMALCGFAAIIALLAIARPPRQDAPASGAAPGSARAAQPGTPDKELVR
jgi:Disulfide bond formation protein DsbB